MKKFVFAGCIAWIFVLIFMNVRRLDVDFAWIRHNFAIDPLSSWSLIKQETESEYPPTRIEDANTISLAAGNRF